MIYTVWCIVYCIIIHRNRHNIVHVWHCAIWNDDIPLSQMEHLWFCHRDKHQTVCIRSCYCNERHGSCNAKQTAGGYILLIEIGLYHPDKQALLSMYYGILRELPTFIFQIYAGNVFPRHRLQRKQVVSDPGMHHGTCVTHVPWYMSGLLTRGGGENVPGFPGACALAIWRIWQEAHC